MSTALRIAAEEIGHVRIPRQASGATTTRLPCQREFSDLMRCLLETPLSPSCALNHSALKLCLVRHGLRVDDGPAA